MKTWLLYEISRRYFNLSDQKLVFGRREECDLEITTEVLD